MKVLYLGKINNSNKDIFYERLNKNIKIDFNRRENMNGIKLQDYDVCIGHRIGENNLKRLKKLKYFIIPFAGIPKKDKKLFKNSDVTVINSHFNSKFVAEHAVALMLTFIKKIIPAHEKMKKNDWSYRYSGEKSIFLKNKNLLIAGHGHIGRNIENLLKCFNMNIRAIRKSKTSAKNVYSLKYKEKLLSWADIIILTLPETKDTVDFISFEEIEVIKDSAYIVNVGRGNIINEAALYKALENKMIKGAAIDTWWNYPGNNNKKNCGPGEYDFSIFDNIIYSPHRSSHIKNREYYRVNDLINILNNLYEGKVINRVDLEKGY